MEKPILLTKKELLVPFQYAIERLIGIREYNLEIEKEIAFEGFFALAVASFENAILDSLKRYFSHIPQKLDIKTESFSKEDILSGNCLERAIENRVIQLSYQSITGIIQYFIRRLSLHCEIPTNAMQHFQEIPE